MSEDLREKSETETLKERQAYIDRLKAWQETARTGRPAMCAPHAPRVIAELENIIARIDGERSTPMMED